ASGLQNASDFANRGDGIGKMMNAVAGDDDVERRVTKRHTERIAAQRTKIIEMICDGVFSRAFEHRRGEIETANPLNVRRENARKGSRATSDVERVLVAGRRNEVEQAVCLRGAVGESEIGEGGGGSREAVAHEVHLLLLGLSLLLPILAACSHGTRIQRARCSGEAARKSGTDASHSAR